MRSHGAARGRSSGGRSHRSGLGSLVPARSRCPTITGRQMHAHADAETGRSPDRPEPGGPIFVVGAARSGTTLMVRILSGHSAVWICNETHHFEELRPRLRRRGRAPLGEVERGRCEDFYAAVSRRPGHRRHSEDDATPIEITRAEMRAEARRRGGDADAYFEAY